jgi:hypothetical protein
MIPWDKLLNLKDYTPLELALFCSGCYLWVIVYWVYIKDIVKKQFVEVPIFAACGNIGWEFTWSFLLVTDMGPLMQFCYRAWFFFDLFIFYGVLRYGWKQVQTQKLRPYLSPLLVLIAVFHAAAFYFMFTSGLDTSIGANSAFLLNMTLSILYIFLLVRQTDVSNFSMAAAWGKMVGTGTNTVFMNIHPAYAGNHFLHFISIVTTTLDCFYIFWLWRMRRQAVLAGAGVPAAGQASALSTAAASLTSAVS